MTGATLCGKELTDRITELTACNLTNEQFGVTELAKNLGISRSNLYRKVKKAEKCSVITIIVTCYSSTGRTILLKYTYTFRL
jgi:DNA-binding transcriptional regulator LsrR (DeoR family)